MLDAVAGAIRELFGVEWGPLAIAISAYLVFILKAFEGSPTVKGSKAAQEALADIRLVGGIVVVSAAVILTGQKVLGGLGWSVAVIFVAIAVVGIIGLVLHKIAKKDQGNTGAGTGGGNNVVDPTEHSQTVSPSSS